jgi:hypothetical protein
MTEAIAAPKGDGDPRGRFLATGSQGCLATSAERNMLHKWGDRASLAMQLRTRGGVKARSIAFPRNGLSRLSRRVEGEGNGIPSTRSFLRGTEFPSFQKSQLPKPFPIGLSIHNAHGPPLWPESPAAEMRGASASKRIFLRDPAPTRSVKGIKEKY